MALFVPQCVEPLFDLFVDIAVFAFVAVSVAVRFLSVLDTNPLVDVVVQRRAQRRVGRRGVFDRSGVGVAFTEARLLARPERIATNVTVLLFAPRL